MNNDSERTIWLLPDDPKVVRIIDQTRLPHELVHADLRTVEDVRRAIRDMLVRGAGLIGATAGFGIYIATLEAPKENFDAFVIQAGRILKATRPTASNLAWAVDRVLARIATATTAQDKRALAREEAQAIADEDIEFCRRIGEHGHKVIEELAGRKPGKTLNILTHCNAGWLAFVRHGSATAPIYAAHAAGIPIHVWVDETRPRNQGASLTAWELGQAGIPHDLVVDNAGGHLMQHGLVDLAIVGADRVTRNGDAANKIGTYLKAVAAKDNSIPFYVALPSSTIDFSLTDGLAQIPIEERSADEVRHIAGRTADGRIETVRICPDTTPARNWGFDVTPARLITGLITERGVIHPSERAILASYPEHA